MADVASPSPPVNITSILPLQLIKSQTIPPAPTSSRPGLESTSDFLPDFAGYSWIAYCASPLLVITHFPNPLSEPETEIGPIFRQVLDLSRDTTVSVASVAWSHATPSVGELSVAWNNYITIFSCDVGGTSTSSFCWSQTAVVVQSTEVQTIKWTGSGDGIISAGIELVMWRRNQESWEVAWKFKPKVPHSLISTTWFADGLSASAPHSEMRGEDIYSSSHDESKCVLVYQHYGQSQYLQAELHHPLPIQMIQWRPSTGKPSRRHGRHIQRPVLLTCCLDGAVRLWSEIDDGRIRRTGKDSGDHRSIKLSFSVVAIIEVGNTLNGLVGSDVFVNWATEVESVMITGKEACYYSYSDDLHHNTSGSCEWLIGVGPEKVMALWAIHCLDDAAPVRYPRITLWNKKDLVNCKFEAIQLILYKVLIMRNCAFGPPALCSLIQLLPSNSFSWTQLYSEKSISIEGNYANESLLTSNVNRKLEVGGHTGEILQVAIHPFFLEVEIAASLDANGGLFFWSWSTFFSSQIDLPVSTPSWKLHGKTSVANHSPDYKCLSWAPVVLDKEQILLMGHNDGIDCFIVKTSNTDKDEISILNLVSIPFMIGSHDQGLSQVFSIPLLSNCHGDFTSSKFLLVALWVDNQALSWEITVHYNMQGTCNREHLQTFESCIAGEVYYVSVHPCSSTFPVPHNDDKITSCSVVSLIHPVISVDQNQSSVDESGSCGYGYHMVTGCVNGSLKLWRSMQAQSLTLPADWVLVGMLDTNQGPLLAISPSPCCRKIATTSTSGLTNSRTTLSIWECMQVHNAGGFMLECQLCLNEEVIALNWLVLGNGQLLLGVCLRKELRVYGLMRCGGRDILNHETSPGGDFWICIAVHSSLPAISDFYWGPKGTIVVVHGKYFSIFSHYLLLADKDLVAGSGPKDGSFILDDSTVSVTKESLVEINSQTQLSSDENAKCGLETSIKVESFKQTYNLCFRSLSEIAEKIGGSLPLYHPEALLSNISSGNWKRAFVALGHLVKKLASCKSSKIRNCDAVIGNLISQFPISNYLEGVLAPSSSEKLFQWSSPEVQTGSYQFASVGVYDAPYTAVSSSSRSEFTDFIEALDNVYDSTDITKVERMQTLALIDLLQEISNSNSTCPYGSLDGPGRRSWVAVRFQQLYFAKRFSRLPLVEDLVASSEIIGWAFHSDCQDSLAASLLSAEPSWEEMRSIGIGFWYTNVTQLRVKMERLARQRYVKNKDPKACALLYIALNRLPVLGSLFKVSKDEQDKKLVQFLSRDFKLDNNKAAALKNAYVLMGKHQLELAVAFFLLGGDTSSAVMVCAKNFGDTQLALVICRLAEGYGGPLERSLIVKFLLPSALSKGDSWMASFLESVLGNHCQSFARMLGLEMGTEVDISFLLSSHASFLDPSIGQYCLMLAMKTNMKNAIGEDNAAVLCRWAVWMTAASFRICGVPLEALECLSSSSCLIAGPTQGNVLNTSDRNLLAEILNPPVHLSSANWISQGMSHHIIQHSKLSLVMQYISKLLRDHPNRAGINMPSFQPSIDQETASRGVEKSFKEFQAHLTETITYFQKFSLNPVHLFNMVVLHLNNNGLEFIGYCILHESIRKLQPQEKGNVSDSLLLPESSLLLRATEEFACIFLKYVLASCEHCSHSTYIKVSGEGRSRSLADWGFSDQGIARSLWCFRDMFQLLAGSGSKECLKLFFTILGFCEYLVLFASASLRRNFTALFLLFRPVLVTLVGDDATYEITMKDLKNLLTEVFEMLSHDSPCVELGTNVINNDQEKDKNETLPLVPEHERLQLVCAALWVHMSKFLEHQLGKLPEVLDEGPVGSVCGTMCGLLKLACADISSYWSKWFATQLLQELNVSTVSNLFESEDAISQQGPRDSYQMIDSVKLLNGTDKFSTFEQLCHTCADPKIIRGAFSQEYRNWLSLAKQKSSSGWIDAYINVTREFESEEAKVDQPGTPSHAARSPLACLTPDDHPFKSFSNKDLCDSKHATPFHSPKEIHKRNGELLEALCVNSTNEYQAGLASNRKGILFFNWEDGDHHRDTTEYIWEKADWPHNGWAGSRSVPVPTPVSPGVGPGLKKGSNLGLGGATIGSNSRGRGSFDTSSYAYSESYGLGWGAQESFDEFIDPPATVGNVRTRAFASHPSRPYFLAGSSNAHIYLWEFGKDTATATYGVLPAANILPPYALASVSSVRFDRCGHRFVTGALDGTVCTWQLEVGGRSNIHPTESSTCFNNNTSDVTYVTASGSIVAAAGYSSSGVNVVVWDTLAPPSTSRASIMCHEGGARSLSVFDNDIASGSISPLIVTGGKGGDVGLHDFRYIATGRTKRHKQSDSAEHNIHTSSSVDMQSKTGDQNRNGMLWYIPKAHSGSVTKISTIPNTSFFLTGSEDGDVKLWDAKRAKLVFHWPKLHERHSFLQPSTRGFSGVVRAGVTDIQAVSHGFLSCGGDGLVKFVRFNDFHL